MAPAVSVISLQYTNGSKYIKNPVQSTDVDQPCIADGLMSVTKSTLQVWMVCGLFC